MIDAGPHVETGGWGSRTPARGRGGDLEFPTMQAFADAARAGKEGYRILDHVGADRQSTIDVMIVESGSAGQGVSPLQVSIAAVLRLFVSSGVLARL